MEQRRAGECIKLASFADSAERGPTGFTCEHGVNYR